MRSRLFAMLAVLVIAGCMTTGRGWQGTYKLCMANRSNEMLQDVIIRDANNELRHFGSVEPSGSVKVVDACRVNLDKVFGILFYVKGQRKMDLLSLSKYCLVRDRIKTLCFCYMGGNEWSVVARDSAGKEVKLGW